MVFFLGVDGVHGVGDDEFLGAKHAVEILDRGCERVEALLVVNEEAEEALGLDAELARDLRPERAEPCGLVEMERPL